MTKKVELKLRKLIRESIKKQLNEDLAKQQKIYGVYTKKMKPFIKKFMEEIKEDLMTIHDNEKMVNMSLKDNAKYLGDAITKIALEFAK